MSKIIVHLPSGDQIMDGDNYKSIKDMLIHQGILLNQPCGGNGSCKKCMVTVSDEAGSRQVLSCQAKLSSVSEITVPSSSLLSREILLGKRNHSTLNQDKNYSVAVDLGSTTVVVALVSMDDGEIIEIKKEWNRQITYGSDVISRVKYIIDQRDGLERLSSLIQEQVSDMIGNMSVKISNLLKIHIAGNTIMQHIFAGIDPSSIAFAPYHPQTLFQDGKGYYFDVFANTPVYFLPCISGYVGGDIVAGIYANHLLEDPSTNIFLDIGTNGEMAIIENGKITTVSVACGPAFEGAEISCGMTGISGAISHISWQENLCKMNMTVLGNTFPVGLCGSGLIDLIALLRKTGYIDERGHLLSMEEANKAIPRLRHARFKNCLGHNFLQKDVNGNVLLYLQQQPAVYLTNPDIRKVQLAKAAVAAGIEFLRNIRQTSYEDITHVYLAGGFGEHILAHSAAEIGMIPAELEEKIISVGNSSLQGAVNSLTDQNALETMLQIVEKAQHIELSNHTLFRECYIEHINF